jgi:hypothetical protein
MFPKQANWGKWGRFDQLELWQAHRPPRRAAQNDDGLG